MEPYQERVIEEAEQLAERLAKLREFMYCRDFLALSEYEAMLLRDQEDAMQTYLSALKGRIEEWDA